MSYLLDTNVWARYLNGRSPAIRQKFREVDLTQVFICSIVKSELAYGAFKSRNPDLTYRKQNDFITLFVSLPFDDVSALIFGRLKAQLELTGEMIGIKDLQIAAIALANNLTLVTHNTAEFGRVAGLKIQDWESKN
ncbi:type II toxin-antitoxin system VapC family toxin [Phormidium pseudopriestleyi FRX01]|uniref:Ribonuclease VapC n=1 Tax=Phormidium pseudopriestleyi FRX01 TaxID=1759528 RepID=A0ABS3FTM5_9CYAN|nr:type II toxin-antitoxin system VapC family toxin [Phormidium pseudopriestleyi]MBO0350478.1 type II toxin-antitoxin system VapC family toxin [Phormidium pseudopriestleyi FRX01]